MSTGHLTKKRLLIIRGDLRSNTGFSRALRSLIGLLSKYFDEILGSDIHFHPLVSTIQAPVPVINDDEIPGLAKNSDGEVFVLHFTTPDGFVKIPLAKNIGYFFWETDKFTFESGWAEKIFLMDELWLPTSFQEQVVRNYGFQRSIRIIPWPHSETKHEKPNADDVQLSVFDTRRALSRIIVKRLGYFVGRRLVKTISERFLGFSSVPLPALLENYPERVLTVAQNVPRKGLILQLSEWCDYIKLNPRFKGCLILKTSSLDVGKSESEIEFELFESLYQICRSRGIANPHVYLIAGRISDAQLESLFESATLYSTHTFGEGFGGPIVEAAFRSLPVITPAHSAMSAFVPPDYPLTMKSAQLSTAFVGQLPCYSVSSNWGIPDCGDWARCFDTYLRMLPIEKENCVSSLRRTVEGFCSPEAVERALAGALLSHGAAK